MKQQNNYLTSVQRVLAKLDEDYQDPEPSLLQGTKDGISEGYWMQIDVIKPLFSSKQPYTLAQIFLRLTILDSLYSTNGRYAQFDLETLSEELYELLGKSDLTVADYFYSIVEGKAKDKHEFFTKKYGLNKNLTAGPSFMSLVSKYAFYLLSIYPERYKLGFPIYDSLALKSYPMVCNQLGVKAQSTNGLMKQSIEAYVKALDELRKSLFVGLKTRTQQFVLLDAYLWRLGKIDQGSITLLLDKEDFSKFVKNADMLGYAKVRGDQSSRKFDDELLSRCKARKADAMLRGIKSETFTALYRHWKEYFGSEK